MRLPGHDRCSYSAITERALYDWPGEKRLAVYVALNLEHFAFGEGLAGFRIDDGDMIGAAKRNAGLRPVLRDRQVDRRDRIAADGGSANSMLPMAGALWMVLAACGARLL